MRAITASFFIFCFLVPSVLAQLRHGFYDATCPLAEIIVTKVVVKHWARNQTVVTAALLRMQFHDCFVNGCDASLLIDSTSERPSEKSARQNANLRGFDLIDESKNVLESACPNTVSCADIVTIATRDSIALAGGPRFTVRIGRRDGLRSNPSDVDLPGPTISVDESIKAFKAKGMTVEDMVALIGGGHTVGVAHCSLFQDRLKDPTMDPRLKAKLNKTCSGPNDPSVFLDQTSPFRVDNVILRIDQNLGLDGLTKGFVSTFASSDRFFREKFAEAMQKMGEIGVLTGDSGEIRTNCRSTEKDSRGTLYGVGSLKGILRNGKRKQPGDSSSFVAMQEQLKEAQRKIEEQAAENAIRDAAVAAREKEHSRTVAEQKDKLEHLSLVEKYLRQTDPAFLDFIQSHSAPATTEPVSNGLTPTP
ncbi:hem peroxidase superfamily [Arabidopsis suecica]|uniref:peroxidase n=1 Tax=Arabidopsis suecica TaxID=45249 RepID=A0A8T2CM37_ARASU|nr:hem peroxidase superfamily [Arabidopsis suecica]